VVHGGVCVWRGGGGGWGGGGGVGVGGGGGGGGSLPVGVYIADRPIWSYGPAQIILCSPHQG